MLKISANDTQLTVVSCVPITSDSIGVPCEITLSPEYDGLAATLVFKAGDVQRDVALLGSPVHVPAECLEQAGEVLMVGLWAGDGSGIPTIRTVWTSAGIIREGVMSSGIDPSTPEPDWAAQVQQAAANAVATANSVRADADAGAFDGADGYSPSATVAQGAGSATITITDKDGTTTATVHDGTDGRDGTDGVDGFSPTATVTQTASGATITVTDQSGTTTASVSNGTDGTDGTDGVDGFSPTVDVQPITGGHEVTITDADGAHSFEVLDGDPSTPGSITDEMLASDGIKPQVAQLFGNQLVGTLSGTIDTAADAYAAPPMALAVYGNSTQAGTPTPDAPVPILSVVDPVLNLGVGSNLLWSDGVTVTRDGLTVTPHVDTGAIDVHGTATARTSIGFGNFIAEPNVTYVFSSSAASNVSFLLWNNTTSSTIREVRSGVTTTFTVTKRSQVVPAVRVAQGTSVSFDGISVQVEKGTTPTEFSPFVRHLITLPVTLRSLPDGTKDELHLSYLRPSTRPGWAWYGREVTACTGSTTTAATDGITGTVGVDVMSTTGEIADGPTVLYKLSTPATTTLDPIELPELPAPTCTVFCDGGSATPAYTMQYVQDTNIVIADLRAALDDLATS